MTFPDARTPDHPADQRIPVTVIGGFLGAGKTTLVNHLIRASPQHFGVIVNEFGAVGVDGGLIEAVRPADDGLDLTELTAGCLCCSGRGDLLRALVTLALREVRPAHVLIELSGVADPVPVLGTLLEPQVRAAFRVGSLVAVADAAQLRRTLAEYREGARQLAYAGVVVLNKADQVSEETLSAAEDAVRAVNPLATIIRARRGQIAADELLARRDFDPVRLIDAPATLHTPGLKSLVLRAERPLDPYRWHAFLREYILSRPAEVLRVKGYLSFYDQPGRILFQSVRDVFTADRVDSRPGETGFTELVVIGRGLEKTEYASVLAGCQVEALG